jgi:hypothetical protein
MLHKSIEAGRLQDRPAFSVSSGRFLMDAIEIKDKENGTPFTLVIDDEGEFRIRGTGRAMRRSLLISSTVTLRSSSMI